MSDSKESSAESAGTAVAPAATKPRPAANKKPEPLPPYHVVLLDDNDHTHEYVIEMLQSLFGHPPELGFKLAEQVDTQGRAIVLTTHREKAELKRDQIHAFGADPRIPTCKGSMSAVIIPAETDSE